MYRHIASADLWCEKLEIYLRKEREKKRDMQNITGKSFLDGFFSLHSMEWDDSGGYPIFWNAARINCTAATACFTPSTGFPCNRLDSRPFPCVPHTPFYTPYLLSLKQAGRFSLIRTYAFQLPLLTDPHVSRTYIPCHWYRSHIVPKGHVFVDWAQRNLCYRMYKAITNKIWF